MAPAFGSGSMSSRRISGLRLASFNCPLNVVAVLESPTLPVNHIRSGGRDPARCPTGSSSTGERT